MIIALSLLLCTLVEVCMWKMANVAHRKCLQLIYINQERLEWNGITVLGIIWVLFGLAHLTIVIVNDN